MSVLDRPAPTPDAVLSYADRPDAVVDVFLPHPTRLHHGALVDPHSPQEARPATDPAATGSRLVIYLHGGFWRQAYDRSHARPLAAALAAEGAVVVLPEFRRVGGGGGWPTTCTDVRDAVTALPALLGGLDLDLAPDVVTLTGHSAGGHLALWLTATGHTQDLPLDRTVAIAPVGDLRDAAATGMGDGAVRDFLGTTEPVDDADPAVLLSRHRPASPVRILHGSADDVVPVANSRGLVAQHPWVDLVELDGVDHFAPIDPLSAAYPTVRGALLDPPTD